MTRPMMPIQIETKTAEQEDHSCADQTGDRNTSENICILQRAYNYLGTCIGYKNQQVDQNRLAAIFADTLAELEKLTHGEIVSNQSKEMGPAELLKKMGKLIPKDGIDTKQIAAIRESEGIVVAKAAKVVALGNYIRRLQKHKKVQSKSWSVEATIRVRKTEQPLEIDKVLEHMENWCDAWLRGDLKDEDWNKFTNCVRGNVM